jgi:hypothetical protein
MPRQPLIDLTTGRINPKFRINNRQQLFTAPQFKQLVDNWEQTQKDGKGGHAPVVKFFGGSAGSWLISEVDPETGRAFGLCDPGLGSPELGYVMLQELTATRFPPFRLPIQRDFRFKASKTMAEYADEARGKGMILA